LSYDRETEYSFEYNVAQHKVFTRVVMAALSSFTVVQSDCTARAARRVVLNAETLKVAKWSTGDVVAISAHDSNVRRRFYFKVLRHNSDINQDFAVGIAWPSSELPPRCKHPRTGARVF
jgi:hypothetical protein